MIANSTSGALNPTQFTTFNNKLYFSGTDASFHRNLYVSDGTAANTVELNVANAASAGLSPGQFATLGSSLYFQGTDAAGKIGLWVSDGGATGTKELSVANSCPLGLFPQMLTPFNGKLYFGGMDASNHYGLWVSDGTAANTTELAVTGASTASAGLLPAGFTILDGKLYFSGVDASGKTSLWQSDGTAAGTQELQDTGLFERFVTGAPVAPTLTINGNGGPAGQANLTIAGTIDVADAGLPVTLFDGQTNLGTVTPSASGAWNATVTLPATAGIHAITARATDAYGDVGTSAAVVYVLDAAAAGMPVVTSIVGTTLNGGTSAGVGGIVRITVNVSEAVSVTGSPTLLLGNNAVATYAGGSGTSSLTFVYAVRPGDTSADLVATGLGLPQGSAIRDISGNSLSGPVSADLAIDVTGGGAPNTFLFAGSGSTGILLPWVSDGSAAGTHVLFENGSRGPKYFGNPLMLSLPLGGDGVSFNGKFYFSARDSDDNVGLWVTDGTDAGTRELLSNPSYYQISLNPRYFVVYGGVLYFVGNDIAGNPALWTSDGTAAGTREVKVLSTAPLPTPNVMSPYQGAVVFNNRFYFAAPNASGKTTLWASDGSAGGTVEIPIANVSAAGLFTNNLIEPDFAIFNGKLYFEGYDAAGALRLWVSDGSATGTSEILVNTSPTEAQTVGGKLFFNGLDINNKNGLWVTTNGTTFLELTIAGANATSGIGASSLTPYAGKLYFTGQDASGKYGLWVTDGTNANTVELLVGNIATGGLLAGSLGAFNGKLYYDGVDSNGKLALWSTDGTAQGTAKIATDGIVGANSIGLSPNYISTINGKIYFEGLDSAGKSGLWIADVASAGTQITQELQVANAYAGLGTPAVPGGLAPQEIVAFNGRAYFSGLDTTGKRGLWSSDGSAANTVEFAVANSNATSAGLNPSWLTPAGSKLYFDGTDAAGKSNLWVSDGTAANTSEIVVSGVSAPDCGRRRSPRSTARSSSTASTPATVPTSGSATARRRTRRKS